MYEHDVPNIPHLGERDVPNKPHMDERDVPNKSHLDESDVPNEPQPGVHAVEERVLVLAHHHLPSTGHSPPDALRWGEGRINM